MSSRPARFGWRAAVITILLSSAFVRMGRRIPCCLRIVADSLDDPDQEALLAAVRVLRDAGPALGRPLVDSIQGSRHSNMKELRPGSTGRTEIRVLFAFDKERKAILLLGGDKSDDWRGWYVENIPIADYRFEEHQAQIDKRRAKAAKKQAKSTAKKKSGKRRSKR